PPPRPPTPAPYTTLFRSATIHHEQRGTRNLLVITQIPYQVTKNDGIVQKISDAIKADRITDISNIVDESSNRVGMRVVIELKRRSEEHTSELQSRENLVC